MVGPPTRGGSRGRKAEIRGRKAEIRGRKAEIGVEIGGGGNKYGKGVDVTAMHCNADCNGTAIHCNATAIDLPPYLLPLQCTAMALQY